MVGMEGVAQHMAEAILDVITEAQAEGNKPAEFSFKNALAVEEIHHGLYSKALEAVQSTPWREGTGTS